MALLKTGCFVRYEMGANDGAGSPYTATYTGANEEPTRVLRRGAPGDDGQIQKIIEFMDQGFGEQVLVSSDLNVANRLVVNGGHGYHYMLANIVPRMRAKAWIRMRWTHSLSAIRGER